MRAIIFLLMGIAACPAAMSPAVVPFEKEPQKRLTPALSAALDNLVATKQKAAGIPRARPCSDEVFLRRVFLDTIGTLPTREEAVEFLKDKNPTKREALIDRLLERPEFADYWGMKWGDVLRVKSEFPVNLWPNAAQAYDAWIRASLRQNMPYSEFARKLLTADGSNFRNPPVNFLRSAGSREPAALAAAAALTFMGERVANWTPEKRADLAVFFSRVGFKKTGEWKEEIVYFTPPPADGTAPSSARLPDGTLVKIPPESDPREIFAQWLVYSSNSPFAKNAANRIWFWIFGRGIIHEPDDSRPGNPPSNPELLAWLGRQLQSAKYDTKQFLRIILNSDTYQLSPIPPDGKPRSGADLASYPVRRLEGEVLIDAINRITGTKEDYMSMIPEPFTFLPDDMRAIDVPDGSITSSFLELFGRPPRDTGLLAERPVNVTASQRLSLLNSKHILNKINNSRKLKDLVQSAPGQAEAIPLLYLTFLSRYPTSDELAAISAYQPPAASGKRQKLSDVAWALVNSPEFLYRH
ncbi:MAG: DUF1553 domain-containing protein [Verrucomicrobia bacterium]|nr:DUF1553 domain-containing protein [Verrucomicrobiota bacterium]